MGKPSAAETLVKAWPAGYRYQEVAGEHFNAPAIKRVVKRLGGGRAGERQLEAVLRPDPRNKFDRNAIGVHVLGELVGYLPKHDAARYQPTLGPAASAGVFVTAPARLSWDEWDGDLNASVTLDLTEPGLLFPVNAAPANAAILPPRDKVQVTGESGPTSPTCRRRACVSSPWPTPPWSGERRCGG